MALSWSADAFIEGRIQTYTNRPFAIGGNEQANQNQVSITVEARFQYASSEEAYGIKVFQLASHVIPQNPINGELGLTGLITDCLQYV